MELSWTTFAFEIINFLVLLWILKIFLYRPVLKALADRQKTIDNSLAEAKNLRQQATELEQKYQSRLKDWELEKQHALDKLQQDIQIERSKKINQLEQEISNEREKSAVIAQRQHAETIKHYQQNAHNQGARFASRLLTSIASPELENRLFELFISSMDHLTEDSCKSLKTACETLEQISISSAYALTSSQQQLVSNKLNTLCEKKLNCAFSQDTELLAGLRIYIGDWVLRFNLLDELSSFSELNHENPIG
ncbi:MAG: F0F1 ATP synthase subunit delta [Gammaproteobacteria bacterium]